MICCAVRFPVVQRLQRNEHARGVGAAGEAQRVRHAGIRFDDVDRSQQDLVEGLERSVLIGQHANR